MSVAAEHTCTSATHSSRDDTGSLSDRLRDALLTQETFTRAQVAWVISWAFRSGAGYGRELAGEELAAMMLDAIADARDAPPFSAADTAKQIERRRRRRSFDDDALAGRTRSGDHPGGPVEAWEDPDGAARATALLAHLDTLPRVPNPAGWQR